MDWDSLKIFLAIAKHGSLSGAAKTLEINHSTVFRRLNSLEKTLGTRLFERFAQGYQLTSSGDEMLEQAQKIAHDFEELERRILGKDEEAKGVVKITAPHNIAYRFLPRYLTDFTRIYPEIHIELLVSDQAFNMNNRQADIAIRATPKPPEHLVGRVLCDIKWGVYASEGNAQHAELPRTLKDLRQYRLIGGNGSMADLPAFKWLEKTMPQQVHVRCNNLVAMSHFVEAGQGLALLPNDQQRASIKRLFTFEPGGISKLWLLTHPDIRNVTRIKLVMRFLAKKFAEDSRLQV